MNLQEWHKFIDHT